jgi:hypothetical protein
MKKYPLVLALFLVSSCGVQLKSVVDQSLDTPYMNTLVVIPYENGITRNFSNVLKEKIAEKFAAANKKVEIILIEQARKNELKLNNSADVNAKINSAIARDNKDLILIFRPTRMQFYNGGLQSATYLITGTDIKSKKEVWKAEFTSSSSFGPAMFAEKAATTIYDKLKMDGVI